MVSLETLQDDIYRRKTTQFYQCDRPINLYQTPTCQGLVTQADTHHHSSRPRNRQKSACYPRLHL